MDARTVADVERWESRAFGGGYDGLHDLADREVSSAVVAGGSYLFMVRGRVVGVFDYTDPPAGEPSVEPAPIDRFADADGTAYEAPHDALALLFAMVASGGERRGRYYSQNTPIEEVDRTLQDGGFTGYLELSENVLSGDYYLVYHGGRRRSVAFVGQSDRLKTDEEAFDRASDEVGIYEVNAVGLSTVEIPGSSGPSGSAVVSDTGVSSDPGTGGDESDGTGETSEYDETDYPDHPGEVDATDEGEEPRSPDAGGSGAVTGVETPERDPSDDAPGTAKADDTSAGRPEMDLDAAMRPDGIDDRTESADPTDPAEADPASPFGESSDTDDENEPSEEGEEPDTAGASDETSEPSGLDEDELTDALAGDSSDDAGGDDSERLETGADDGAAVESEEAAVESAVSTVVDDETTAPDDDPSGPAGGATPADGEVTAAAESELDEEGGSDAEGDGSDPEGGSVRPTLEAGTGSTLTSDTDGAESARVVPSVDPARTARAEEPPERANPGRKVIDGETVVGLRSELSDRESRIEELRERLSAVEAERDELAERVDRLEERLAESGTAPLENTREVSPAEALSGTSILFRHRSKTGPTLEAAHEGNADREALAENLLLEPHPTFDTEGVAVSGLTFEAFVEGSQAYRFLRWLVGEFPFEVRETESVASLGPLYEALPTLDRVEFDATVALDGADRETARFDLVGRDRRGNPLLVAHLEDDRAPTDGSAMEAFVTEATAAAESHDALAAAFAVTASYFEPAALTTAEEATGGSLLSRSKRKSFVKTSRKGGYHLCLVEDREESFYLTVPDL